MKILVTGSNGFIGKHLCDYLLRKGHNVLPFDLNNSEAELEEYIKEADFIVHLAGVNRPINKEEFYQGNFELTKHIVDILDSYHKQIPILMSSSIQAELDNDYGKSKKMAEDYLLNSDIPAYIYRLANVFGRGAKPNYNSAVATFCYNIAHDLDVVINPASGVIRFNYIDDVVKEFYKVIESAPLGREDILTVHPTYKCDLFKLVELLQYFKKEVESERHLPIIHSDFELKLFKTFLYYLSDDGFEFNYSQDKRGYFEELYKSKKFGQISDNVAHPGIRKGGHYHTYKKEIFYVVIGKCVIRQRNINTRELIIDEVSGRQPKFINIIPYYTHDISTLPYDDSHTLMWISEIYEPDTSDTYRMEVDQNE